MSKDFNVSFVYRISLIATLGGFLFGYGTAVISGEIGSLEQFFIKSMLLTEIQSNALLGVIVSSALFGCVIGSVLSAFVLQKFGRKKGLLLSAFLFLISAVGSSFPEIGFKALGESREMVIVQYIVYSLMALGTPEMVTKKTMPLLEIYQNKPRLVTDAGCALPPTTPEQNIRAMIDAVRNF